VDEVTCDFVKAVCEVMELLCVVTVVIEHVL
jgi:hypothetical protein